MNVGEKMKKRRLEIGISADKLAEILGVSRATIYRYEGGGVDNLPAEYIKPLAKALRTTPQYLLSVSDNPEPPTSSNLSLGMFGEEHPLINEIVDDLLKLEDAELYEIKGYVKSVKNRKDRG